MNFIQINGFGDFDERYTRNTLSAPDGFDFDVALENFKEYNKEDLDVLDQDSKNYLRVIYGKSQSDLSDRFVIYLKTLGCVDPKIHTITVGY